MNTELTTVLEQLANTLGTTTEYLWGVLIHQAYINGIINLIYYITIICAGIGIFKLHIWLTHIHKDARENSGYTNYDEYDELAPIIMIILAATWTILAITCIITIGDTINSFIDPEYWALNNLLNKL